MKDDNHLSTGDGIAFAAMLAGIAGLFGMIVAIEKNRPIKPAADTDKPNEDSPPNSP